MSAITHMTVDADEFLLGRVLSRDPGAEVELERAVPAANQVMPYLWVAGVQLPEFERRVRTSPHVRRLVAVDVVNNQGMYRIEWADDGESLLHGIRETGATILSARGADTWEFVLQFEDYGGLARFHNYCRQNDIDVSLDMAYSPDELEATSEYDRRTEL
ncbi:bacterio-opsin activator domain-containing protein [Haloarcula laminariae]|uniref:bacterio-opsin activator domain-containing protein n=1 Tax=Haloarcula laminariae TaxID=2961577 RepID=UPI002405E2BF|nr:bacterio-opsin activator domain-containing protein [Halomicroarcula sp. FL173]